MLENIPTILAIGAVVSPIFYGFLIFKMSDRFITRTEFQDFKTASTTDRAEMKTDIKEIKGDIKELIAR